MASARATLRPRPRTNPDAAKQEAPRRRLADYNPSEEEIRRMFPRGRAEDEVLLDLLDKHGGSDAEQFHIARLLFLRGEREASFRTIEGIGKESFRRECLRDYFQWVEDQENDGRGRGTAD